MSGTLGFEPGQFDPRGPVFTLTTLLRTLPALRVSDVQLREGVLRRGTDSSFIMEPGL